jgi:hypothetical protein
MSPLGESIFLQRFGQSAWLRLTKRGAKAKNTPQISGKRTTRYKLPFES